MIGTGRWAALLTGAGVAAIVGAPSASAAVPAWRFHADGLLGTSLDMVAVASDADAARAAAAAVRAEIYRLDPLLSGWRDDSELAQLNAVGELAVSPDLFAVIAACEHWRGATGAAFDARQGLVLAAWRDAERTGRLPDPGRLRGLHRAAADAEVRLDPSRRTIVRPPAVVFAPDALAKGYVVDAALAAARAAAPGLRGLMIDLGGDLRCWGQGPSGQGWRVGVADPARPEDNAAPAAVIAAGALAVATSGGGPRDLRVGGARFSHLIGAEGQPARTAAVSVVARTAADADALATAFAVMEPEPALALADRSPGVEVRISRADGSVHRSSGWSRLALERSTAEPRLIRIADAAAPPWPEGFALTIDYTLPVTHDHHAYRSYVAIWVTDADNRLVRGLVMLGDKLDYVSENYVWWRRYARSRPQLVAAISRPTRRAGRYSAVWDGKDDLGVRVGQGRYTVHIEGVREGGGHGYQSIPVELGAAPTQAAAEADEELGPSAVRYGRGR